MLVLHTKTFIIHPGFFDTKNIFSHPFIQNLRHKPNTVQYLSRQIRISLLKKRSENSVKQQIEQIICITSTNGKTEYRGSTYAKNDVVLELGWISDSFEFREPEFYKLVTTVTRDDDSRNIYTVPVGRCFEQKFVDDFKYEEKRNKALTGPGESTSKKEPSNTSEKKTMRLYIFPGAPTLFYQQGNHNSCISSSLVSALHHMGDDIF